jgi:hypothetical protein
MKRYRYKLYVQEGPDVDRIQEFSGADFVVGRASGINFPVTDELIALRHFRLTTKEERVHLQIVEGESPAMLARGATLDVALKDAEVFTVGRTRFQIHILVEETLEESGSKKSWKRLIPLLILLVLMVGGLGFALFFQQKQAQQPVQLPALEVGEYVEVKAESLPAGFSLKFPDPKSVVPVPTNRISYGVHKFNPRKLEGLSVEALMPGGGASWPRDPYQGERNERDWRRFEPRLGSWRFLPGNRLVLGNYNYAMWTYRSDATITPENPNEKPFELQFHVEIWDGLPPVEVRPASSLGLTTRLSDERLIQIDSKVFPLLPRRFNVFVPSEEQLDVNQVGHQSVQINSKSSGLSYRQDMHRSGEYAVIITTKFWTKHGELVDDVVEAFLEQQDWEKLPAVDAEAQKQRAEKLEQEADVLIQPFATIEDAKLDDHLIALIRAFNRYHEALICLQRCGKFGLDPDFSRVFDKALQIHDYLQREDGRLPILWSAVENFRLKRESMDEQERRRVREIIAPAYDSLFELVVQSEEPGLFPPSDWFRYVHGLKRDELQWFGRRE